MALNGFFLNVPSLKGAVRTVFDKSDSIASGSAKNAADTVSGVRLSRGGRPPPSNIAGAAANIKPNTRFELATPGDRPVVAGSGTALERSHPACATIDISRRKIGSFCKNRISRLAPAWRRRAGAAFVRDSHLGRWQASAAARPAWPWQGPWLRASGGGPSGRGSSRAALRLLPRRPRLFG